jgi:hypothetical protein
VILVLLLVFWRVRKKEKRLDNPENVETEFDDEESGALDDEWEEDLGPSLLGESRKTDDRLLSDFNFSNLSEEAKIPAFFDIPDEAPIGSAWTGFTSWT